MITDEDGERKERSFLTQDYNRDSIREFKNSRGWGVRARVGQVGGGAPYKYFPCDDSIQAERLAALWSATTDYLQVWITFRGQNWSPSTNVSFGSHNVAPELLTKKAPLSVAAAGV